MVGARRGKRGADDAVVGDREGKPGGGGKGRKEGGVVGVHRTEGLVAEWVGWEGGTTERQVASQNGEKGRRGNCSTRIFTRNARSPQVHMQPHTAKAAYSSLVCRARRYILSFSSPAR